MQDLTSAGLDWDREKWRGSVASKFIRGGEKNAVKYADEIIVLSKGVQKYFMDTYGRETHFIPNGVNRPEVREAKLIKELAVVQEELQQKKQIAGNTEVLLTADNLQQYVKKIEVDHKKNTYTEFVF